MKSAEALLERKGAKDRIDSLRERIKSSALAQEGDTPTESPEELLNELNAAVDQMGALIRAINRTNNAAQLADDTTLSEAIVRRDMLRLRRQALEQVVESSSTLDHFRYSRNEVKFVATLDAAAVRKQIDRLAKEWRDMDAQIQATNWMTDVDGFVN